MSACQSCHPACQQVKEPETNAPRALQPRFRLFNWVTALLLSGWVGIVVVAVELAGPQKLTPLPTLESFLRALL